MAKTTDTTEREPKQRPVKRPAKPRGESFYVPNGVSWTHMDMTVRYLAGSEIRDDKTLTPELRDEYLQRGDIVAINDDTGSN